MDQIKQDMQLLLYKLAIIAYPNLESLVPENIIINGTKVKEHGDLSSNIALLLAKKLRSNPIDIANNIVAKFSPQYNQDNIIRKIEVLAPGFINFFLVEQAYTQIVDDILLQKKTFGANNIGLGQKVHIEFVSANPTGPLHVGHGRGAIFGSSLSNVLSICGYDVTREYYVNDIGRQIDILLLSIYMRYLEQQDISVAYPVGAYQGNYIKELAAELTQSDVSKYVNAKVNIVIEEVLHSLPENNEENAEIYIDSCIAGLKNIYTEAEYLKIKQWLLDISIKQISSSLEALGINYDNWFHESSLVSTSDNKLENTLTTNSLQQYIYTQDNKLIFKSSQLGDDKDRVIIRSNGVPTYFATDIAYHHHKYLQKFDKIINVWGADHHGYVARINSAMSALGHDTDKLEIKLIQFASLVSKGKKVSMSTRKANFVTLEDLYKEIGVDAVRFFYLMRRCEQHMDFDLDLAVSKTKDNPVYYVQYAHTRTCSVAREFYKQKYTFDKSKLSQYLLLLQEPLEKELLKTLHNYILVLQDVIKQCEPYLLTHYLRDLAGQYHSYYNSYKFLLANNHSLCQARFALNLAVGQVIANGLELLSISQPEYM